LLFSEEIFPNKTATVYHRTTSLENIQNILSSGIKPGTSDLLYGQGLYTTFDINSQFNEYMERYGDILIKFKVAYLEKYLIFPTQVAKYIFGKNYKISDQLKNLSLAEKFKQNELEELDQKQEDSIFTGELFKNFYDKNSWIEKKLFGVIYRGQHDGYCLLKYFPIDNSITLLGYVDAPVNRGKEGLEWKTSTRHLKIKNVYSSKSNEFRSKKSELDLSRDLKSLIHASKTSDLSFIVNFLRLNNKTNFFFPGRSDGYVSVILNNWPPYTKDIKKYKDLIRTILKNSYSFNKNDVKSILSSSIILNDEEFFEYVTKNLGKNINAFDLNDRDLHDFFKNLSTDETKIFLKNVTKNKNNFTQDEVRQILHYYPNIEEIIDILILKNQQKYLLKSLLDYIHYEPEETLTQIKKVLGTVDPEDKEYYFDFVKNSLRKKEEDSKSSLRVSKRLKPLNIDIDNIS
jgi:hypothetical protein